MIAVGTTCFRPENIHFDGHHICDSDQFLSAGKIPHSVLVIGAGVIGVEYASILNVLGRDMTIIDPRKNYLEFIDREIIDEFTDILTTRGVKFRLGKKLQNIVSIKNNKITVALEDGELLETEMVLYAAGRSGATTDLNLDCCNIGTGHRGRISVDPQTFQTSADNIYAVDDVIGFPALASTSMAQGRIAVSHAFGKDTFGPPAFFPYGIYSVPEISTTGLTELEAQRKFIPYVVGKGKFVETSRGLIMGVERGLLKLLFSRQDHKLLWRAHHRRRCIRIDTHWTSRFTFQRRNRLLH